VAYHILQCREHIRENVILTRRRGTREVRIGVMVGPVRGRDATKVDRLRSDAVWAESVGLASASGSL